MAIDFPATPSVGQIFTAAGASWRWNGVKWVAATAPGPAVITNDVGRNLVHNPLFNIAQRGAGPFTLNGAYTLDRWLISLFNGSSQVTQTVLSDAARAAIGDEAATASLENIFTGTAATGDYNLVAQYIENVRRLGGKTVTVSFWGLAAASIKLGVSLTQLFGTGGSPSANVAVAGQAVTLSTAWTRYTLTFTVPSTAGKTLGTNGNSATALNFWFSSGATNAVASGNVGVQSGDVVIWGVQLEIGSVATPLEKPDPADDLRKCQRFYIVFTNSIIGYAGAGGAAGQFVPLPAMRAAPTLAFSGGTFTNCGGIQGDQISPGGFRNFVTVTAAGAAFCDSFTTRAMADL